MMKIEEITGKTTQTKRSNDKITDMITDTNGERITITIISNKETSTNLETPMSTIIIEVKTKLDILSHHQ